MHHWFQIFATLAKGLPITLSLAFLSAAVGLFLGMILHCLRLLKGVRWLSALFVYLFTSTPLVLQLFFVYYGVGKLLENYDYATGSTLSAILRSPYTYAFLALTCNTASYFSLIIKSSLAVVARGEIEAAKALGMTKIQTLKKIVIPQSLRYFLPTAGNELILLVKGSTLVSVITVLDVTGYMQLVFSQSYDFFQPLLVAAFYYVIINLCISAVVVRLERKFV